MAWERFPDRNEWPSIWETAEVQRALHNMYMKEKSQVPEREDEQEYSQPEDVSDLDPE